VPSCQQHSSPPDVLLLGAVFTNRLEDLRISELAEEDRKELVSGVQVRACCLPFLNVQFVWRLPIRRWPCARWSALQPVLVSHRLRCRLLQEYFGDYVVLDTHHFVVPVARPASLLQPSGWDFASWSDSVARTTEGLAALALSLRRRFQIRCRAATIKACAHSMLTMLHRWLGCGVAVEWRDQQQLDMPWGSALQRLPVQSTTWLCFLCLFCQVPARQRGVPEAGGVAGAPDGL
jgi:hypothetical protein